VADNDCGGGGTCHSTAKICLVSCPGATLATRDDVDDRRFCREFTGDLSIPAGTAFAITSSDFPYLTRVRGSLEVIQNITDITFTALETIDRSLNLGGSISNLKTATFPALRTVGSASASPADGITNATGIQRIEMPALTRINGYLNLFLVPQLTRANFAALQTVTGDFDIGYAALLTSLNITQLASVQGSVEFVDLPKLAYSVVRPLHDNVTGQNKVGGTVTIQAVGCCFSFGQDAYDCTDYVCE
jgi:hypothetical protein